jgi:hypothetical protein
MTTVKKIGRYLTADAEGCLIPDVSAENIQPRWQPLVRAVIDYAAANNDMLSLYLRGSVPRGSAVDGASDLDLIAIIREEASKPDVREIRYKLLQAFPFCQNIEWIAHRPSDLARITPPQTIPYLVALLKTQALHLWGENFVGHFPPVKPGVNTMFHTFQFEKKWQRYPSWLGAARTQADIDTLCVWMGKRILRTAFELAAREKPIFTRDIYPCYEVAAAAYPEMKGQLYAVLELTIGQNAPSQKILKIFSPAANFLIQEKNRIFPDLSATSRE